MRVSRRLWKRADSLIEFIVRARHAPVTKRAFLASLGTGAGVEYLAQIVLNALFVSKGHREDTELTLVLERSADFSRAVTLSGNRLGSITDLHEQGILSAIAHSLAAAEGLGKEAVTRDDKGIQVQTIGFERLVRSRTEASPCYLLDPGGTDIRESRLTPDSVFVMTDHIPMPYKAQRSLTRLGVSPLSLGPVMLHTSQCITLVHNEMDRCSRWCIRE